MHDRAIKDDPKKEFRWAAYTRKEIQSGARLHAPDRWTLECHSPFERIRNLDLQP